MTITPQNILRVTVGLVVTAVILYLIWFFSSVVIYILVSAVLAIMGRPLANKLSEICIRGRRLPRWCAATLTLIVIWIVLATIFSLFIPLIFGKINEFASLDFSSVLASIEEPIAQAQLYIQQTFAMPETQFSLTDTLITTLKNLIDYDTINNAFSSIVSIALSTLITIFSISFITFFFLKEDGLFYAMVKAIYFTGILTESIILTIIVSTSMILFGMKTDNALLIGLIMGVMNVIPYAGPLIGGVISVCIGIITPIEGFTTGHTIIVIACTLLCIKGLDDFILQPTLYSERVKAHPLEVFLVILIAGYMAGILGMLLAIPSYTVLRVLAKEFFSEFSLVQKLTQKI